MPPRRRRAPAAVLPNRAAAWGGPCAPMRQRPAQARRYGWKTFITPPDAPMTGLIRPIERADGRQSKARRLAALQLPDSGHHRQPEAQIVQQAQVRADEES